MLPFRKLMLLDVLATNAESESPRPVYFHTAVSSDFYRPLKSSTRRLPFVDAYVPGMTDSTHLATLAHNLELPLYVPARDSMPTLRKDPVIADQVRRQRGKLFWLHASSLKSVIQEMPNPFCTSLSLYIPTATSRLDRLHSPTPHFMRELNLRSLKWTSLKD